MTHDRSRLDMVRDIVNDMLDSISDPSVRRAGYEHLYGVSQLAVMLALKRNLPHEEAELLGIAGILHDYTKYKDGVSKGHAEAASREVKPLLINLGCFTEEEIKKICTAISLHSTKDKVDTEFDEILKDADGLQHCLANPTDEHYYEKTRNIKVFKELDIKQETLF